MSRIPRYKSKELELDFRILSLLQKYSTISNTDLVIATGFSPRHVRNRCHTLAAQGYICRIGIKPMFWHLLPDPRRQHTFGGGHSRDIPTPLECRSGKGVPSVSVSDYYSPPGRLSIDYFVSTTAATDGAGRVSRGGSSRVVDEHETAREEEGVGPMQPLNSVAPIDKRRERAGRGLKRRKSAFWEAFELGEAEPSEALKASWAKGAERMKRINQERKARKEQLKNDETQRSGRSDASE